MEASLFKTEEERQNLANDCIKNAQKWANDLNEQKKAARARERAIKLFDQAVIADQAMSIYERILNEGASSIAENVSLGQA